MMRFAIALATLALAGCANPQYHSQRAAAATPAQLCEAHFYGSGEVYYAATNEMHMRKLDCNQYRQEAAVLYQARIQRQQSANQNFPNPFLPKPTVNCTTTAAHGIANTTCR